jgi:hypothetical protein
MVKVLIDPLYFFLNEVVSGGFKYLEKNFFMDRIYVHFKLIYIGIYPKNKSFLKCQIFDVIIKILSYLFVLVMLHYHIQTINLTIPYRKFTFKFMKLKFIECSQRPQYLNIVIYVLIHL